MRTVYGLTNEHGQIVYVGQTGNLAKRWQQQRGESDTGKIFPAEQEAERTGIMKPVFATYQCQVCGESSVMVQDHDILRCFACIDAGRMPDGVETGSRVRPLVGGYTREDLYGILWFGGIFLIGLVWLLWIR